MKKTLIVVLLLIAMFSLAQSQTFNVIKQNTTTDIIIIPSWSPWANAVDSSNKKYSKVFDISAYDSINCWFLSSTSPSRGVTDLKTVLLVGANVGSPTSPAFDFATNDTTRVLCDSTIGKSAVLTYQTVGIQTMGLPYGKLALTPYCLGAATTNCNHSNDILNYVLICHKRQ